MTPSTDPENDTPADANAPLRSPRLWRDDGWTASVMKNDDDEGWAVAMIKDGEPEPALIGPWTMGRDKKNPKPLDGPAFSTLVKTASEFVRRHEQQLHATLHRRVDITIDGRPIVVTLDITPDEDDAYAMLAARDTDGVQLAEVKVAPSFKLNSTTAYAWAEGGFQRQR